MNSMVDFIEYTINVDVLLFNKNQLWMETFGQNKTKDVFLEYSRAFDSHN